MVYCKTPACPSKGRELEPNEIEYFASIGCYVCKHCTAMLEDYSPPEGMPSTGQIPVEPIFTSLPSSPEIEKDLGDDEEKLDVDIERESSEEETDLDFDFTKPTEPIFETIDVEETWHQTDIKPDPDIEIQPQEPFDDPFGLEGAQTFPRIEVHQGGELRGEYQIKGDVFTIGRYSRRSPELPNLDFMQFVDGKQVSRQHARIVQNGGQYYIQDLGSSSGTWLNDAVLDPNRLYPLHHDDTIGIGDVADLVFLLPAIH